MSTEIRDKSLLSCWPDGFSRYYSVSRLLDILFEKQPTQILDVGGDSEWMYRFLADTGLDFNLTIVDTRPPDAVNKAVTYVRDDFFKLSKKQYRSDAVINTDVLEHVPQDLKIAFVNRCIEFTESVAIFSAPQDETTVTQAEKTINRLAVKVTGKQQRWLKEHFAYGKPNAAAMEKAIKAHGYPYIELNTNNVDNWLLSFVANLVNQNVASLPDMDKLNRFYNQHIGTVGDFEGTAYRKIFVVIKDKAMYERALPKINKLFTSTNKDKMNFQTEVLENLATKLFELQESLSTKETRSQKLDAELDRVNRELLTQTAKVENLENELAKIFSKKWFKAINKVADGVRPKN